VRFYVSYQTDVMNILLVCKKFPYPIKDGGSIAVLNLSKSLAELGCNVTLLTMNTTKHFYAEIEMPEAFEHFEAVHHVAINNQVSYSGAFFNLFSQESYHVSRFISPNFETKLIELLTKQHFDIVQLETPMLAPYISVIREVSKAKVVMRSHNVEYEIWKRIANNTPFFLKRWYLHHAAGKLKRFEIDFINAYDLTLAITQRDLTIFKKLGLTQPSLVVPVGLDCRDYSPDLTPYKRELSVGFIGSLDWLPNQEGLIWFFDHVWSKVSEHLPKLTLHIAGLNTPKWLYDYADKRVKIYGEVENATRFMNKHVIMLAPIFSGSGMRVKILEAMALGRVVITTTIGLEGIEARHGEEVLIADTPQGFIECIDYCYKNRGIALKIGQKAQILAQKQYDNFEIGKKVIRAYTQLDGAKARKV
jgi:polysaccharide biosynthesis protein PslH